MAALDSTFQGAVHTTLELYFAGAAGRQTGALVVLQTGLQKRTSALVYLESQDEWKLAQPFPDGDFSMDPRLPLARWLSSLVRTFSRHHTSLSQCRKNDQGPRYTSRISTALAWESRISIYVEGITLRSS
ncbi:hypothetical protein E4U21_005354 [Claviceps maximensis]|nr:hypothetical protein E4U21_005354 [Claviceps maximensis]